MKKTLLSAIVLFSSIAGFSQNEGDIIITELMTDPSGNEGNKEWFEIYNTTSSPIDMNGWIIEDISSSSKAHLINTSVVVQPNSYAVFSPGTDVSENGGISNIAYAYGFASSPDGSSINADDYPRLNNEVSFDDGDTSDNEMDGLVLTLGDGTVIDEVMYNYGYGTPSLAFPPAGTAEGYSIELAQGTYDSASNDDANNWVVATLPYGDSGMFGTPGNKYWSDHNEGDIIITEFMTDADGNEDLHEWFEVYNTTSSPIDMNGWIIEDISAGSRDHLITSSVIVQPHSYAIFSPSNNASENGGINNVAYAYGFGSAPDGSTVGDLDYPKFNNESSFNDGDTSDNEMDGITLTLGNGTVIDEVMYNYGYGTPSLAFPPAGTIEGYTIELVQGAYDSASNDDANNWVVATLPYGDSGMFGTPGDKYWSDHNEGDIIITEMMTDPSGNEGLKEWFEVYNTTSSPIDMNGWIIEDISSSSKAHLITTSVVIQPNSYAVFSPSADASENGGISDVAYAYGFASSPDGSDINADDYPRLNNEVSFDDGDTSDNEMDGITLTLGNGTVIDEVMYNYGYGTPSLAFPPAGTPEGYSIELSSNALDSASNDIPSNWMVATAAYGDSEMFGTPGEEQMLSTSIFEKNQLMVYPNPASGEIHISLKNQTIESLNVFNTLGQQVISQNGNFAGDLDVSSLKSGLYILQVSDGKNKLTKKVIIQ